MPSGQYRTGGVQLVLSRRVDLVHVKSERSGSSRGSRIAQALAAQVDAIAAMDDDIEDRIGQNHRVDSSRVMTGEPAL